MHSAPYPYLAALPSPDPELVLLQAIRTVLACLPKDQRALARVRLDVAVDQLREEGAARCNVYTLRPFRTPDPIGPQGLALIAASECLSRVLERTP